MGRAGLTTLVNQDPSMTTMFQIRVGQGLPG